MHLRILAGRRREAEAKIKTCSAQLAKRLGLPADLPPAVVAAGRLEPQVKRLLELEATADLLEATLKALEAQTLEVLDRQQGELKSASRRIKKEEA